MKVLMIVPEPFFTPRGTPISVLMRARALSQLGHEIHILTYHIGEDVKFPDVRIHRIPKVPFIKHVPIGLSYQKIILDTVLFIFILFYSIKEKYDIIHAHEEGAILGVILKKIFGIPLIYDMHSRIKDHLISFFRSKYLAHFGFYLEILITRNSDMIIVISKSLNQEIHRIINKKVFIIENIPILEDILLTKEKVKEMKEKYNIKNESVILYTGTFESYQGLEILIKSIYIVIESQKNVKLLMVGGEKRQVSQLKMLCKSLKITKYVKFTGKRPLNEIPIFMEMAHVLVSPRTNERDNPPLKLYTYLNSNIPIVATNVPANTQILTNEISVLTDLNPGSFAKGIISILEDKELRSCIIENMKKIRFNYSDFLSKLDKAYSYLKESVLKN